jgi:opacity protein-like surface antigen
MSSFRIAQLAPMVVALAVAAAFPARGLELYIAGDLGISWYEGRGVGVNDIVAITNSGNSEDASPVYGGALGVQFPLNDALPWKMRLPAFGIPYWPGRELRFREGDEFQLPDWGVRTEVEYLGDRDAELTTPSFNPLDSYRADVKSWTLMGNLRVDVPIDAPVRATYGRVPFLEPLTIYVGGGAGIGNTELDVSTGVLAGSNDSQRFAWQALAGIGYDLNDRVKLSLGWRYVDLEKVKAPLFDQAAVDRGRYEIDPEANEFTASLSVRFWRLPPLLGD